MHRRPASPARRVRQAVVQGLHYIVIGENGEGCFSSQLDLAVILQASRMGFGSADGFRTGFPQILPQHRPNQAFSSERRSSRPDGCKHSRSDVDMWCENSQVAVREFANKSAASAASGDYVKFQAVIKSAASAASLCGGRARGRLDHGFLGAIFGRASAPKNSKKVKEQLTVFA